MEFTYFENQGPIPAQLSSWVDTCTLRELHAYALGQQYAGTAHHKQKRLGQGCQTGRTVVAMIVRGNTRLPDLGSPKSSNFGKRPPLPLCQRGLGRD